MGGAETFQTDAGNAAPLLNTIIITGGSNLGTTGAGNTVTFNLDSSPSVAGSLTAGTTIDAGTGISTTTGNITATAGRLIGNVGLTVGAGSIITNNIAPVAATPYVVAATDYFISVDTSLLAITIQLPNAPSAGRIFVVKDSVGNAAAQNITVTTVGGTVLLNGAVTFPIAANWASAQFIFDGAAYLAY